MILVPEQPNLQIKITKHPNLTFLFDPVRDEYPNRPYHIDGDPKMYTEDMISIRMNLKNEAKVKKAINNVNLFYFFC